MAATITVTKVAADDVDSSRSECFILQIAETSVAAATEVEVVLATHGLPTVGRIHARICQLTSGTGTTIDPIVGDVTNPSSGAGWKMENATAAASTHEVPVVPIPYAGISSFFHRSVPDTGSDNAVTTLYYIEKGW